MGIFGNMHAYRHKRHCIVKLFCSNLTLLVLVQCTFTGVFDHVYSDISNIYISNTSPHIMHGYCSSTIN